jgi:hypothetical protein
MPVTFMRSPFSNPLPMRWKSFDMPALSCSPADGMTALSPAIQ